MKLSRQTIIFYGRDRDYWQPFIDRMIDKLIGLGNFIDRVEITNPNPFRLDYQPIHHADIYYEKPNG